jgi:membrane-associated phospholipid phosphatase
MLCLLFGIADGRAARADDQPAQPLKEITIDLRLDVPIVLSSVALLGATQFTQVQLGVERCNWCETPETLNRFDAWSARELKIDFRKNVIPASDVLSFARAPLFALGVGLAASLDATRGLPRRERARRYGIDVLLITEAVATSLSVMQIMRIATQRNRPYTLDDPTTHPRPVTDNLSFPSGHSLLAFSAVSSAAMISSIRRQRLAPLLWVCGLALASGASVVRVPAENHYATDIIVGGLVGTLIGTVVPLLHARRSKVRLGGAVFSQSGLVTLSGAL